MRVLFIVLASLAQSTSSFAQWHQMTGLTGGSIVTDVIEFNSDLYVATDKTGIFRLNDASETWEKLNVPAQPNFPYLVVHNSELLAITYGKIFRTGDGTTWTEAAGPLAFINDVSSDGTLIVAATTSGIYLSSDAGVTWSLASDPQTQVTMIAAAVKGDVIWASAYSPAGTLFRSIDGGANWTKLTKGSNSISQIFMKGTDVIISEDMDGVYKSSDQGANWQLMKSVTTSDNEFYASASNLYLLAGGQLSVSTNDGNTWTDKADLFEGFNSQMIYGTSSGIYLGTWGGGVVKTDVNGTTPWLSYNAGLLTQMINELFVGNGSMLLAAGSYSFVNTTPKDQVASSEQLWTQQKDGNGFKGASATTIGFSAGGVLAGQSGGGVHLLVNYDTWEPRNDGLVDKNVVGVARVDDASFVATGDGVYKSSNYLGEPWIIAPVGNTLAPLMLHSDYYNLFAGTYDGLYLSRDEGETWTNVSNNGIPGGAVPHMAHLDSVFFAATASNGIYRSNDLGQSWTHLDNFSLSPVQSMAAEKGVLLASTFEGNLYSSVDNGDTWTDVGGGISHGVVRAIAFDLVNYRYVAVGTNNSGVWIRPWNELVPPHITFVAYPSEAFNAISFSTFPVGKPISVFSDQQLTKPDGTVIADSDLVNYVSVNSPTGPAEFTATVQGGYAMLVTITNAVPGIGYTVTISNARNSIGTINPQVTSQVFTAFGNQPPVVSDFSVELGQEEWFTFNKQQFADAFTDADNDEFVGIIVKSLPEHGSFSGASIYVGSQIWSDQLDDLVYYPYEYFPGVDSWTWAGHDGVDLSANNATIQITGTPKGEAPITGVRDSESLVKVYPVPTRDVLHIQHPSTGNIAVTLHSAAGTKCTVQTITSGSETTVDMSGLAAGLYVVRVESGGKIERKKVWKTNN